MLWQYRVSLDCDPVFVLLLQYLFYCSRFSDLLAYLFRLEMNSAIAEVLSPLKNRRGDSVPITETWSVPLTVISCEGVPAFSKAFASVYVFFSKLTN